MTGANYLVSCSHLLCLWTLLALRDLIRKDSQCSRLHAHQEMLTPSVLLHLEFDVRCMIQDIRPFHTLWLNWLRYATTCGHVTPTLVTIDVNTPGQRQTTDTINATCGSELRDVDTNHDWVAVEQTEYKLSPIRIILCEIVWVLECASWRRKKASISGVALLKLDNRTCKFS